MTRSPLPDDPLWPRAGHWITSTSLSREGLADLALLGVPTYRTSITPTQAHATPAAVRDALLRYSTYCASQGIAVARLSAIDLGDVAEPDGPEGEARVLEAVSSAAERCRMLVAVGGDNSITYSAVRGFAAGDLSGIGLITVDAHHDLRDGVSNGSPVRRLAEAGLPGANIVQVGIADFSNSAVYAARAQQLGITVVPRSDLRGADPSDIARSALAVAGEGGRPVFVDIDVDVCDRAEVPGCPSSAPGGISADELRQLVFAFASDWRVVGFDLAEIDATADSPDARTVRLAALLFLEAAAGLAARP
jgi:formiminoglutamase